MKWNQLKRGNRVKELITMNSYAHNKFIYILYFYFPPFLSPFFFSTLFLFFPSQTKHTSIILTPLLICTPFSPPSPPPSSPLSSPPPPSSSPDRNSHCSRRISILPISHPIGLPHTGANRSGPKLH